MTRLLGPAMLALLATGVMGDLRQATLTEPGCGHALVRRHLSQVGDFQLSMVDDHPTGMVAVLSGPQPDFVLLHLRHDGDSLSTMQSVKDAHGGHGLPRALSDQLGVRFNALEADQDASTCAELSGTQLASVAAAGVAMDRVFQGWQQATGLRHRQALRAAPSLLVERAWQRMSAFVTETDDDSHYLAVLLAALLLLVYRGRRDGTSAVD